MKLVWYKLTKDMNEEQKIKDLKVCLSVLEEEIKEE